MVMKLTSLTAVFIARDFCASIETVRALADALAERVVDVNIIIVANGAGSVTARTLNALASAIPDVTVLYLATEQHDDVARLLGIEQAIGDYILFARRLWPRSRISISFWPPQLKAMIWSSGAAVAAARLRGGRSTGFVSLSSAIFFIWQRRSITLRILHVSPFDPDCGAAHRRQFGQRSADQIERNWARLPSQNCGPA